MWCGCCVRKPWAETAAEVRAVIDEYAGRINQGRRNVNKLATSAELYGNASPETLASRAKTRDKVNAQTESNRKISKADKTVGSLLDIMQYEGGRTLGHTVAGQAKDGQCRRIPAGRTRRRPGARLAQRRSHQQGARCLLQQLEDRHQERIEVDTDALYANISDVLNGKKRVDSGNKADVNIINQIEDDLDENLNINAFRGED